MVHTFNCLGRAFALDVESGSVFEVSPLTKSLIERKISPLNEGDFSRYSKKEIEEAQNDIDQLTKEGILFSSTPPHIQKPYEGTVKALCLNISHNCNLRCTYCFADGGSYNTKRENMSLEVAKSAIDFLIAKSKGRRNLEVDFFGGEPLLNFETVKETVKYARGLEQKHGKNFRFTITTNALGLTDEIIDYFNKEMHNVVISIDGRKEVHNLVRKDVGGNGSFDIILKNALKFRAARGDKSYYIRGTFTQKNKDFAADALALNDLGFDQVSLEPVVLAADNPLALTKNDVEELSAQYEILAAEYIKRRAAGKDFNFFHFNIDFSGGPCAKKRLTGCGAGSEYLAVAPDGSIYPCHRFDGTASYKTGNVLDKTFDDALPKHFYKSDVTTKKDCEECFCKYFCSGGCAANSIFFEDDIIAPHKFSCALMKKRTEVSIAIYALEHQ